jgi:hypothetical protein
MTHGFEQDTPVGFGNMTWYTGPHKNLVVLDNTPSPDYQWFYDPTWSYTTAQITSYQEAIRDKVDDARAEASTAMERTQSLSMWLRVACAAYGALLLALFAAVLHR